MEHIVEQKKAKAKGKKLKKKDFKERYLNGNLSADPDGESRPEKDPKRVLETPAVIAALNNDQFVKSKSKDLPEERAPEGAALFSETFIHKTGLTGDEVPNPGDVDAENKFSEMEKQTETSLNTIKKKQEDKIRDLHFKADSQDQMEQAIDYELLDGDSKLEQVNKDYLKKVDRVAGQNDFEQRFKTASLARKIQGDITELKHKQSSIKQKYQETYPEGEKKIRTKLRARADQIHGESLRERDGKNLDREPDSGFW